MAAVLGGFGILTLLVLHLLPGAGGVDPVNQLLSEYPVRPDVAVGVPYVLALLCANAAAALVGRAMARSGLLRGRLTKGLFALSCVSQLVLACVLWWRYRADSQWRGYARAVGWFAALTSVTLMPFVVAFTTRSGADRFAGLAIGLFERSMFVVLIAMTAVVAYWARAIMRRAELDQVV